MAINLDRRMDFDFDRGMGIRGLRGSRPTSFQYEADPIIDAIVSRQDANNSMNRATDQYEADVADFKDTIAKEKEQGIAGLPNMRDLNNSPFISEGINSIVDERGINRPNIISHTTPDPLFNRRELPPTRDLIDYGYGPGIMPPTPDIFLDDMETKPMPFKPTILHPPRELPPTRDLIDYGYGPGIMPPYPPQDFEDNLFKDIFTPPNEPPVDVPPPFRPPIDVPPITVPPTEPPHWHDEERRYPPGYDRDIDGPPPKDDIYVPPPDDDIYIPPPPPPPPPPSGPINYYTGEVINNPYTPYATDSGAPALSRRISPASFGMAPGMFPPPPNNKTIEKPDELPPDRPDRNNAIFANQGKYLKNSSLNKGIMRLPQSQQGDTMTTQMFQRAFRPRR